MGSGVGVLLSSCLQAAEDESGVTVNYLGILTLTGVKHWRKNSASDFH